MVYHCTSICHHSHNSFTMVATDALASKRHLQPSWWHRLESIIRSKLIDGLVKDCSNSIANALELLHSCTRLSMCRNSTCHTTQLPIIYYCKASNIRCTKPQNINDSRLVSCRSCLCPIHWSQMLSREQRCSWSSADRRCSNYIWVIKNFIATKVRLILEVWW